MSVVVLLGACGRTPDEQPRPEPHALDYVGRATCERCHALQVVAWTGSDHDRAMSSPSEGLLGEPLAANVEFGLGFEPLQQYLVATEGGRLQVLPFAWDARPVGAGGQRWFEPNPGAAQHWRGPAYIWNHACAECHSTGVHEGYDAELDVFTTTFAELDVSCESCHGRGSEHVRWADRDRARAIPNYGLEFELRGAELGAWRFSSGDATAERIADAPLANELDVCARCHSRRSQIHEDHPRGASLLDTHVPSLIEPPLYFEDGQIRDEVYEYGSFLQSRMHGAGVTCSDCHDPHGLKLRAPGNALCGRCHAAQTFDTPAHHRHSPGSVGASCVECHMPARVYMGIDPRRDHSLRVPRPDLSVSLGVPNACEACHAELGAEQLAAHVEAWGVTPDQHFGEVLARARAGDSAVGDELLELLVAPDTALMVRATAASLLGSVQPSSGPAATLGVLQWALSHEQPLVRLGALAALDGAAPAVCWSLAAERLDDPIRAIRFAAVRRLAAGSTEHGAAQREAFDRVLAEYTAALRRDADRAETHVEHGNLLMDLGRPAEAELAYARAIERDPSFAPAYVNWCELSRRRADEAGCADKLEQGLARRPDSPELHYAAALSLIRRDQREQAITALRAAVDLAPEISTYAYALVLALRERGREHEAAAVLHDARALHPHDRALRSLDGLVVDSPTKNTW